jgi:F0F1-type ATP synthase delta subunit
MMMNKFGLPSDVLDKIYEIKTDKNDIVLKIVSYFPLSDHEKDVIRKSLNYRFLNDGFSSIFSDVVDNTQWNKSKDQIKKRFNDELFDIDNI